ncbi:hypothetical protein U9M48_030547 [Paspalum notatum var. saurae]|uniref:Uncharacterized protein n=1 Tax=Paspalum notatum var. saurae TaxID=547442 RepID=A0AAQ3U1L8_PASNO
MAIPAASGSDGSVVNVAEVGGEQQGGSGWMFLGVYGCGDGEERQPGGVVRMGVCLWALFIAAA